MIHMRELARIDDDVTRQFASILSRLHVARVTNSSNSDINAIGSHIMQSVAAKSKQSSDAWVRTL